LFSYPIQKDLRTQMCTYLRAFVPDLYSEFENHPFSSDNEFFAKRYPSIVGSILENANMVLSNERGPSLIISKLPIVLIPWVSLVQYDQQNLNDFNLVIKVLSSITCKIHIITPSLVSLWKTFLDNSVNRIKVFESLTLSGACSIILNTAWKALSLDKTNDVLEASHKTLIKLLTEYNYQDHLSRIKSLYRVVTHSPTINTFLALETTLLIQINESMCKHEALDFVYKQSGYKNSFPSTSYEVLNTFYKIIKNPADLMDELFSILPGTRYIDIFKWISAGISALSELVPESSYYNAAGSSLRLSSVLEFSGEDESVFCRFIGSMLTIVSNIATSHILPEGLLFNLLDIGLKCVNLVNDRINDGIIHILNAIIHRQYQKDLSKRFLSKIVLLMLHGDQFYSKIFSHYLSKIDIRLIDDPVSHFWITLSTGITSNVADSLNGLILNSCKVACVFSEFIAIQKLTLFFQKLNTVPDASNNRHIKDFVRFLMLSNEVNPYTSMVLLKTIKEAIGEIDVDLSTPVEKIRISLNEIEKESE